MLLSYIICALKKSNYQIFKFIPHYLSVLEQFVRAPFEEDREKIIIRYYKIFLI